MLCSTLYLARVVWFVCKTTCVWSNRCLVGEMESKKKNSLNCVHLKSLPINQRCVMPCESLIRKIWSHFSSFLRLSSTFVSWVNLIFPPCHSLLSQSHHHSTLVQWSKPPLNQCFPTLALLVSQLSILPTADYLNQVPRAGSVGIIGKQAGHPFK